MAKPRGPQAHPPAWAEQPQKAPHGPEKRVCANEDCRRPFVPSERQSFAKSRGLCPRCCEAIAKGEGWKLGTKLYAECQQALLSEPKLNGKLKQAAYEAEQLAKLAAKPLRQPFIPSSRGTGRKKGARGTESSGNEGRY